MTQQDVKEKMQKFIGFMSREKELRDRLLKIKMQAKDLTVLKDKISEHDRIIEEIDSIREKGIFPIAEELCEFLAETKKRIIREKEAQGEKITEKQAEQIMRQKAEEVMQAGVLNSLIEGMGK